MPTGGARHRQRGSARARIMDLLLRSAEPPTTSAIVARLGLTRGFVLRRLAEMEAAGWLAREAIDGDRREQRWRWRDQAAA